MTTAQQSTIVIIGDSPSFLYLLQRYTDRSGYSLAVALPSESVEAICRLGPVAVILSSMEILEAFQSLVAGLANCDVPIIVCSSAADPIRARAFGADYCLLHPVTYDDFQNALAIASAAKRT